MQTRLNPYLSFTDQAAQAMTFYHEVFGGKLDSDTFAESGMPHDPAEADHIMHAQLTTESGMVLMVSDTPAGMQSGPVANGSISLSGDNEAELRGYYEKLSSDGGIATLPLDKAPWGDIFGMCTDKFGVNWLVNITAKTEE